MELADKIRILRKARVFSQEKFGDSLSKMSENGISRQSISDWETGKSEPKLNNLRDIKDVLNVSYNALLDDSIDLNNQKILDKVLKNLDNIKDNINTKVRKSFYEYNNVHNNSYLSLLIVLLVVFVISIVFVVLGINGIINELFYIVGFSGIITAVIVIPIILIKMKRDRYNFEGRVVAELNNTHLIISIIQLAENVIYIPIEKIENMEIIKTTKRCGDVFISIKRRKAPIILKNIVNPNQMLEFYQELQSFIENDNEIKIL